jgi:hypothetical protein
LPRPEQRLPARLANRLGPQRSLDSAGIECHLADDNVVRMDLFTCWVYAIGLLSSWKLTSREGHFGHSGE